MVLPTSTSTLTVSEPPPVTLVSRTVSLKEKVPTSQFVGMKENLPVPLSMSKSSRVRLTR